MDRRRFLKAVGGGAVGMLGVDSVLRHATTAPELSVTLYQTLRASKALSIRGEAPDVAMEMTADAIRAKFAPHFDLDVDITFGELTVPNHLTRPYRSSLDRYRALADWVAYDPETPKAQHSNLLIDSVPGPLLAGIATPGVLPVPCCRLLDGHGIVWHDFGGFDSIVTDAALLQRTALHELGHTVGLTHAHGCTFERNGHSTLSIMLSAEYAARYGWNRYGQQVTPSDTVRPPKFNDRIEPAELRI